MKLRRILFVALAGVLLAPGVSLAQSPCCVLPDNGTGTADLPPNCVSGYNGSGQIVDGLAPASTIQIAARLANFSSVVRGPGGGLGGEFQQWNATLDLVMTGTGVYSAYNRFLVLNVVGETHSAPRTLFAPVQSFATDMYLLQGQVTLDPDFDLLRVTAGTGFGMPSPGQTTLTQAGPGWAVDSFFDITFRVDFVGNPGGPFAGRSGSTTNLLRRFDMCHENPTPVEAATWGRLKASYR